MRENDVESAIPPCSMAIINQQSNLNVCKWRVEDEDGELFICSSGVAYWIGAFEAFKVLLHCINNSWNSAISSNSIFTRICDHIIIEIERETPALDSYCWFFTAPYIEVGLFSTHATENNHNK